MLQALLLVLSTTPPELLYNLSREAGRHAPGHTASMWWSQDWSQLGQTFARLSCGLWAGPGYPEEKGQGKAGGSIEEEGVDAFVSGPQRQRRGPGSPGNSSEKRQELAASDNDFRVL